MLQQQQAGRRPPDGARRPRERRTPAPEVAALLAAREDEPRTAASATARTLDTKVRAGSSTTGAHFAHTPAAEAHPQATAPPPQRRAAAARADKLEARAAKLEAPRRLRRQAGRAERGRRGARRRHPAAARRAGREPRAATAARDARGGGGASSKSRAEASDRIRARRRKGASLDHAARRRDQTALGTARSMSFEARTAELRHRLKPRIRVIDAEVSRCRQAHRQGDRRQTIRGFELYVLEAPLKKQRKKLDECVRRMRRRGEGVFVRMRGASARRAAAGPRGRLGRSARNTSRAPGRRPRMTRIIVDANALGTDERPRPIPPWQRASSPTPCRARPRASAPLGDGRLPLSNGARRRWCAGRARRRRQRLHAEPRGGRSRCCAAHGPTARARVRAPVPRRRARRRPDARRFSTRAPAERPWGPGARRQAGARHVARCGAARRPQVLCAREGRFTAGRSRRRCACYQPPKIEALSSAVCGWRACASRRRRTPRAPASKAAPRRAIGIGDGPG